MREIPNTRLLISLFHAYNMSANLEIFDISQKEKARRVYSFEEAFGGQISLVTLFHAEIAL